MVLFSRSRVSDGGHFDFWPSRFSLGERGKGSSRWICYERRCRRPIYYARQKPNIAENLQRACA